MAMYPLTNVPADLCEKARAIRCDVVRMLGKAGSGHTGGSLSVTDLLTALYFSELRHDPQNPHWPLRDRVILSKGHAAPALYAILTRCGYFPASHMEELRTLGGILEGHPDKNKIPGIDASIGSLGQGLSLACGMAAAARQSSPAAFRVFAILGDGECNEGQVWEAAMSATHYRLSNLVALVDHNGLQIDGRVCDVMNLDPLADKWLAFGWAVQTIDGHNFSEILNALARARSVLDRPSLILAKTVKGRGLSFAENQACWHGVAPNSEQVCQALDELQEQK